MKTRLLLTAACVAIFAASAVPAPQKAEEKPPDKVQKITDGLEVLITRIDEIQGRVRSALEQAKQARSTACSTISQSAPAPAEFGTTQPV